MRIPWKIPYNAKDEFFQFPFRFFIMWNSRKIYVFYEFFGNPSKVPLSIESNKENKKTSSALLEIFQEFKNCLCF